MNGRRSPVVNYTIIEWRLSQRERRGIKAECLKVQSLHSVTSVSPGSVVANPLASNRKTYLTVKYAPSLPI